MGYEEHEFLIIYQGEYIGTRSDVYAAGDAQGALAKFELDNIGMGYVVINIQQIN